MPILTEQPLLTAELQQLQTGPLKWTFRIYKQQRNRTSRMNCKLKVAGVLFLPVLLIVCPEVIHVTAF